jgi:hypothetical protein
MHLVSILLPIETVVTLYSCVAWFLFPEATISPDAVEAGWTEFDAVTHYCLHLVPFLGLSLNFASYLGHFR